MRGLTSTKTKDHSRQNKYFQMQIIAPFCICEKMGQAMDYECYSTDVEVAAKCIFTHMKKKNILNKNKGIPALISCEATGCVGLDHPGIVRTTKTTFVVKPVKARCSLFATVVTQYVLGVTKQQLVQYHVGYQDSCLIPDIDPGTLQEALQQPIRHQSCQSTPEQMHNHFQLEEMKPEGIICYIASMLWQIFALFQFPFCMLVNFCSIVF